MVLNTLLYRAKLEQLRQKLRFARDRVTVEVRDAVSALSFSLQRLELARAESEVAQRLAEAERERFELGDSTVFMVNLRELSAAFDGLWDFRSTERPDRKGIPLELHQSGATITGCLGTIEINGTVNGAIARATGVDSRDGRPSAFILVADEDGSIQGLWSRNRGRFGARTAGSSMRAS